MRRASSFRYFSPASLKVWPSPDVFQGDLLARKSHPDKVVMPDEREEPETFYEVLLSIRLAALHSGGAARDTSEAGMQFVPCSGAASEEVGL